MKGSRSNVLARRTHAWLGWAWVVVSASCAAAPDGRPRTQAAQREGADRAAKYYDVAVGSFHNGMFEDAKIQIDKALREDPDHADSHYLYGVLLLNEGKAIMDALEIQQCLTDEAAQQQRERAEMLHRGAGTAFERAARAYPEGASGRGRAYNSISVVSLFFHDAEAARSAAKHALGEQFYTDRYSALSNLGWAQYLEGDTVSATASLRQAVLINPGHCVGHYRLAQIYLDADLHQQALDHAREVVSNDRCPIQDAHRIAGVATIRLGDEEAGLDALRACVELAPRSCQADDCRRLLGPQNAVVAAVVSDSA